MKHYQHRYRRQREVGQFYGMSCNSMDLQQKAQLGRTLDSRVFRLLWLSLVLLRDNILEPLQK